MSEDTEAKTDVVLRLSRRQGIEANIVGLEADDCQIFGLDTFNEVYQSLRKTLSIVRLLPDLHYRSIVNALNFDSKLHSSLDARRAQLMIEANIAYNTVVRAEPHGARCFVVIHDKVNASI